MLCFSVQLFLGGRGELEAKNCNLLKSNFFPVLGVDFFPGGGFLGKKKDIFGSPFISCFD